MNFDILKCVSENVSLDDYYNLYNYVIDNMDHKEWLGLISREETTEILNNGGKIWLYYYNNETVCSMMYIPANNKTLIKHNITYDEKETGALGPIMVNPKYIGNGFMSAMLKHFEDYNRMINNKYIFTKVCKDNIYSKNNLIKNKYEVTDEYKNERGTNISLIKKLNQ